MSKVMYISLIFILLVGAIYVGYYIGFNQNVMGATTKALDEWCIEHDTNCIDICNQICILKNQQCSSAYS